MSKTIKGTFDTRRQADMVVERLVQELGVERTDIFVVAAGDTNSDGVKAAGSDREAGAPSPEARDDGAHEGAVEVSLDLNEDGDIAEKVQAAFDEFGATMADR